VIRWQALVPIKQGGNGKSRLAEILSQEERDGLSLRMARHVLSELDRCEGISDIMILSAECPDWWSGSWAADGGQGLNAEINGWRQACAADPILIIHADLPLLLAEDVRHLLDAAEADGIALATDRAGEGSNALAIADGRPFDFRFGPNSKRLHAAQSPGIAVIQRNSLSADIDIPDDLTFARVHGFTG
jgi:2-phospho-L-lactate/phosphoenolpyruvate guanylyltransferase